MTNCAALNFEATANSREQQMQDIAGVWAVLVSMDDLPATFERRAALSHARRSFQLKLQAAGISEDELRAYVRGMASPQPRLRAVPDD